MALAGSDIKAIVKKHAKNDKDTGSSAAQVALLTKRLNDLNEHFRKHSKDHHSRRGLMKMVGQRKRLLTYMQRTDADGYKKLIDELGLRK